MVTKSILNASDSKVSRDEKLLRYEEAIKTLALTKSSYIFQNEDVDHAAIVIKSILKYSHGGVVIYDDDLSGDVSDKSADFTDIVRSFAENPGRNLKLVIKNKSDRRDSNLSSTLHELIRLYPARIQVKVASQDFVEAVNEGARKLKINTHINFAVSEDNAFRLEFPVGMRKAFCSFNDESYSSVLLGIFKKYFNTCTDYFDLHPVHS